MKRTDIKTLIEAMRILSEGIQSEDGVANAAIAEAGLRLQEQNDYIKRLEEAGDLMSVDMWNPAGKDWSKYAEFSKAYYGWVKLRESKP